MTIMASDILTPEMAIKDGLVFKREDGTPLDPTTMPYGTVIQRYHPVGKPEYFDIRAAPTHIMGVNGELYAFTASTSPEDIAKMAVPLGPKNAGTATETEIPHHRSSHQQDDSRKKADRGTAISSRNERR